MKAPKRILALAAAAIVATVSIYGLAQEHGGAAPAHGNEPAGHGGGEHAAGEHGGHHTKELNVADIFDKERPALVALLINFGLLVGLYYTMGKKPIAEALKQRKVTVGKEIEDAQKMLEEAQERAKKYQGDLKNADTDAAMAKTALVAAAKGEVEHVLADANEKAERMKRDAERLVEQERKQVREDLLRETVDLSVAEAMKVLERAVTPEDHQRLAQDLLRELSSRPAARATGGAS